MNHSKWLKIVILFTALLLGSVIIINIVIDTYGVYLSLFAPNRSDKINPQICIERINQRIYNTEFVLRNPKSFDSFLFGSSLVGVIDTSKISSGNFYNMSYAHGFPAQHLAIIKAFIENGIRIKSIIIGLDEFSFILSPKDHEDKLLTMMHPAAKGKSRAKIFHIYFFRMPKLFELTNGLDNNIFADVKCDSMVNKKGLTMGWLKKDEIITATGKPLFIEDDFSYSPFKYEQKLVDEAFANIEEIIELAKNNNISLIFFFNPIYSRSYVNFAEGLLPIKERLARYTDFYDFSGFNSVTTNNFNYYEYFHYRYMIGDMIVQKINGNNNASLPKDFCTLVTKNDIKTHIKNQKLQLKEYLANKEKVK
jgi:hypothetical protein